jgi:colanic acid biosynthesis glycosyl transferase WcaI
MRVLFVTPYYAPDLGPAAALYEMLCEGLVRMGCTVSVVCAVPHYPTGSVTAGYRGRLVWRENRNGVDVTRVWVPSLDRRRLASRLLSFVCFQVLATVVALGRRHDVLCVSSPALETYLPFFMLNLFLRQPAVYSVHEIYPDIGVKLGYFRHRSVIRVLNWMERWCCRRARYVRALSEGYKRQLEAKGVPSSKLAVIWDWIDTDFLQPMPRRNTFSAQWDLDGPFVVMYAGNLGSTQGLEYLVETAQLLADEPSIRLVLVGDGIARPSLQESVKRAGLSNVQFIPFQPRESLPLVLASADVLLNTVKKGFGTDTVPSKLYSIMASARPAIATIDSGTDTWDLIQRAHCGVCVEPDNPRALTEAIRELYRDAAYRTRLGANGRTYVTRHHSKEAACREFYQLLCWTVRDQRDAIPATTVDG